MWEVSLFFPALQDLLSMHCHFDDYRDEQRFTEIHEEVLGLRHRGLEAALDMFPWKLNDQDAAGRTALYWAVVCGDYQATHTLIEAGADPNICDLDGYSPLHRACALYRRKSQTLKLVTALIHAGVDVNAVSNTYLETAFHFATVCSIPAVVTLLLDHGSNINAVNVYGVSPLNCAVRRPVSNSTRQILLDRGASTGYIRMKGITVLHDAAFTGNAETYRFLQRARISDINIERKAEDGQTALRFFWSRKVTSEELLLAYLELECSLYAKGWEGYMNYLEQQHPDIHDHVKHLRPKGYDIEKLGRRVEETS
jgi:ankyrin repeat protein